MVVARSLPAPPTALIARASELAALCAALTSPDARLLTVTGPPGVGKTRLALAAATAVAEQFTDGALWVDLASLRESRLVLAEITRALGVATSPADSAATALKAVLAELNLLIVLDNCEHLLAGMPELGALLASCPQLRILATSRERLHLAAEREFTVPPLLMPSDVDVVDLGRLRANPAIMLLLDRAPAHVTLTQRTARALADICVRLDGLPLALELAAARLRVFTPSELAFRLEDRMALLTGGSLDLPGRHRDLRAAIMWSHSLLSDTDRAVFRQLSVFVGDWTVDAAVAVCWGPSGGAILDALESLLDKSLIRRVAAEDGEARFGMLVSLREFAAEQLDLNGELDRTRLRHTRYVAAAARRWEATVGTSEETATWPQVGLMLGDLRTALADSLAGRDADEVLWLATGLGWHAYTRGSLADAADLVEVVCSAVEDERSSADARAAALIAAGMLAFGLGDLDVAERHLLRAAALADAHEDERRAAHIDAFRGHVARGQGRREDAAEFYAAARAMNERTGNQHGTGWADHDLGLLASDLGELDDAEHLLRASLRVFRTLDYEWAVAVSACALATVLLRSGKADEPAALLGEALALHDAVGDRRGIAQCLEAVADVALARGAATVAGRLLGAASAQRRTVAARPTEAEQAWIERLDSAVARVLGRVAAEHEAHSGATMPAVAAIALAAEVTAARPVHEQTVELTPRQRQVAALVAASNTNRQIGRALGISEKTAEIHVRNIMERLHTPGRAGVASWATAHGLQPPP